MIIYLFTQLIVFNFLVIQSDSIDYIACLSSK